MEIDNPIKEISAQVCERKLEVPAILVLESLRPLRTLGFQLSLFAAPLLRCLMGVKFCDALHLILRDDFNYESFVKELENSGN